MGMYSGYDKEALKLLIIKADAALEDLYKNGPRRAVDEPGLNRDKLLEAIASKHHHIGLMKKELDKKS